MSAQRHLRRIISYNSCSKSPIPQGLCACSLRPVIDSRTCSKGYHGPKIPGGIGTLALCPLRPQEFYDPKKAHNLVPAVKDVAEPYCAYKGLVCQSPWGPIFEHSARNINHTISFSYI